MGIIRGLGTLILMLAFIGLCIWVFLPSRKKEMEDQGKAILDNEPNVIDITDIAETVDSSKSTQQSKPSKQIKQERETGDE